MTATLAQLQRDLQRKCADDVSSALVRNIDLARLAGLDRTDVVAMCVGTAIKSLVAAIQLLQAGGVSTPDAITVATNILHIQLKKVDWNVS